jgi:hypothetical protein
VLLLLLLLQKDMLQPPTVLTEATAQARMHTTRTSKDTLNSLQTFVASCLHRFVFLRVPGAGGG